MKQIRKTIRDGQEGSIVLEACISVIGFLIFMLLLYSIIVLFMAQNVIGHTLVESAQSLALDGYATEALTEQYTVGSGVQTLYEKVFDKEADDPHFSTRERWYDRVSGATGEDWDRAAKERFIGYLAGGDESKADEMLEAMGVVDGLDGLDFSESEIVGKDLYLRIHYELQYILGRDIRFKTTQQSCSRLWGASLMLERWENQPNAPGKPASAVPTPPAPTPPGESSMGGR